VSDEEERVTYWCKRADGQIVEHQSTAFENHHGHVHCVPVPAADPQVSDG
jgi:hypothetical protein